MIIRWKTRLYSDDILKVECVKATARYVTVVENGIIEKYHTLDTDHRFHDTWEDAREWLVRCAEQDIKYFKREVMLASMKLENLQKMRGPKK
jgi:hypothetical protein